MRLAYKLGLSLVVVSTMVGLPSTIITNGQITKSLRDQIGQSQAQVTEQTMDKIDRFLYERQTDVGEYANEQQVAGLLQPGGASAGMAQLTNRELHSLLITSGVWNNFYVFNTSGNLVGGSAASGSAISSVPGFGKLLAQSNAGQAVGSGAVLSNGTTPTMLFFSPVTSDSSQAIIGSFVGEMSWPSLLDILNSVHGSAAHLVSQTGLDLGDNHSNDFSSVLVKNYSNVTTIQQALHNPTLTVSFQPSLADPKVLAISTYAHEEGFLTFAGNNWLLELDTPEVAALAPLTRTHTTSYEYLLFALCAGGIWWWLILRYLIIRPISRVRGVAVALGTGVFDQRVTNTRQDEIGDLGRTVNTVSGQLWQLYKGIEAESKEAKLERQRLLASINSLRQGFIIVNRDLSIELMNQTAQTWAGGSSSEGEAFASLVGKLGNVLDLKGEIKASMAKLAPREFPTITFDNLYLHVFLTPIVTAGESIGCVVLLTDVTEVRIMERSKDEFFSIASHELRTPLTAIRSNAALITQYYDKKVGEENFTEMVDDIHSSSIRLIEIVNDFLDASRLEQGKFKFNFESFAIEKVIESVIYEMAVVSREKKIRLKYDHHLDGLPKAYADVNRVKQVIYNLLGNAMKFTEKGSIAIAARVEEGKLKVLVTDTGRGIDLAGQQLLFHKFQQTGSSLLTRDTTRGTGLGLYISKLLLENMGGKIQLETSAVGKGSTFSFTVPLATAEQIAAAKTESDTSKK